MTETPGMTTVKSKTKYNYRKSDSGHGLINIIHHGPRSSQGQEACEADFCLRHSEPREATLVLDLISTNWFLPLMDE